MKWRGKYPYWYTIIAVLSVPTSRTLTLCRTFIASNDQLKESGPNWDRVVGVELYEHDDAINSETGGVQRGCNWDVETRNLDNDKSMAKTKRRAASTASTGLAGCFANV